MADETKKTRGRPKASTDRDGRVIDDRPSAPLRMEEESIEVLAAKWRNTFTNIAALSDRGVDVSSYLQAWNRANPFIQNQRVKGLSTPAATFSKEKLAQCAANPAANEAALRAAAATASSSQQIYYNILRRACDVPVYHHFVVPEALESESGYSKDEFRAESVLVDNWFDVFNVPNSLKTISLQVKREGKCSYILRNRFIGYGKQRRTDYAVFEKLPTDWIKITGIGQLGYTVSFDFSYFLQVGNDPAFFGQFFQSAWKDMLSNQVVTKNDRTGRFEFDIGKCRKYSFKWGGYESRSMVESVQDGDQSRFIFWLSLPFDLAYTFASDNSTPFVAPDTIGLLQKLQELTDYGTLAGLIASTPLTSVLTGEAEFVENARPGKNETKLAPEVLLGLQTMFNSMTSSNTEAYFLPLKNIKLQQLNADVNSSDITTKAMRNLIAYGGEGGLTITTDKPSIAQVRAAEKLAAEQQHYVTLQIENALNYIVQHNLGFKYRWKVRIWGDIFFGDEQKAVLKEQVQSGNVALLPKLMSADGLSMSDTRALTDYVMSLGVYDKFRTLTQDHAAELGAQNAEGAEEQPGKVGRPSVSDGEITSDATGVSKDSGANTKDGRETNSAKCPVCHEHDLPEGMSICESCLEKVMDEWGE